MRWEALQLTGEPPAGALFAMGAVARTFDTPGFRGITFHEIHAKSIINRVPDASRVPFRWTINPYRGCTHACVYCLAGDTPVLMADGRTAPIADLRVGDHIVGTERAGNYRRYVTTEVLAHWQTVKPAFRITLADGTALVASGDHRFLTERGWKHVSGDDQGLHRRPHLTINNSLIGVGRLADPPKHDDDYRRGYLTGMIRGDGHLGSDNYRRHGRVHRFRLALVDIEALTRSRQFLAGAGVDTTLFEFPSGPLGRQPMKAIRCSAAGAVATIGELIAWPHAKTLQWQRGFLAGIFDAEGSYSRGILRICNSDAEILTAIRQGLDDLGLEHALDGPPGPSSVGAVRLRGGIREQLRFFLSVDPAITRKRTINGAAIKCDARLDVRSVTPLGIDIPMFDLTTGTGDFIADGVVSHNCFARKTHTYLDLDAGHDFDSQVVVKVNAVELLRRELARPSWRGEHIAMGTNTDPYQRAEGRYAMMPGIIGALAEAANPFSILTKGSLIERDIPLLAQAAEVTDVSANVSVGYLGDPQLWRAVEPGTPAPERRLAACRSLNDAGIPCGVLMAPILPFLTDSDEALDRAVAAIAAAGAVGVSPIVLHLRPGAREWFLAWLAEQRPDLVPRYRAFYGRGSYAPAAYQQQVAERVARLATHHGITRRSPRRSRGAMREAPRQTTTAVDQPVLPFGPP